MRKIANLGKSTRLLIQPQQIIRFDDKDHFHKLLTSHANRSIAMKKGTISKHAQILALSAA